MRITPVRIKPPPISRLRTPSAHIIPPRQIPLPTHAPRTDPIRRSLTTLPRTPGPWLSLTAPPVAYSPPTTRRQPGNPSAQPRVRPRRHGSACGARGQPMQDPVHGDTMAM
jgi:hypothetical protein